MVGKACRIASKLRELGVRPYGVVRIDSAAGPADWAKDPEGNTKKIAADLPRSRDVAEDHGERLAAEGEICWGGMHSWKDMVDMLEEVDRPQTVGFQADMAHTLLYTLGYNAPEDRACCREATTGRTGRPRRGAEEADRRAAALDDRFPRRPERRHRQGLRLPRQDRPPLPGQRPERQARHRPHAGYWLRDDDGKVTKTFSHICWDGCMFPNEVMMKQQTWNDILAAMIQVRDNHGWVAR